MAERLISRKQSALLSRKKSLLNEINYYESKVNEESLASNNNNLCCDDSSDSECEFTLEVGLSITELKLKQRSLKTCLQATQELTGVTVLQSEVNALVRDPVLEGERPISEEGMWREVTAECRIDLVPFSINYYVHKPSRMFGPMSYRNLQVTPVKASHEVELAKSILKTIRQPSDAIEIIRNYSAAHRSRRTTLARLAEKYGEALFMVPMPEGGYRLKCAELMEVQWSLQNKWSPLAPFHHKMVFDLEFMDESYIKTISTLHKQIIDPTIDTDDRTLLLAKIINTCLEAKAHTTQNQAEESTESESEAAEKLRRRRTTLDQEPQEPERNRKKDSEVMAPPKSLPKKTKPKGKENTTDNKTKPVKRVADDVGEKESAKKAKTTADKLTEKNTENKTKNTKTKPDKVNKDNNENSGGNVDDGNVIMSDINPKKAKMTATDKLTETKNTEIKTKNSKSKTDKVNKDNNANDGGKFDDANVVTSDSNQKKAKATAIDKVIETKNTESKTKSTKTKPDKNNKDNNANKGEKIDGKNVIMSDKNPKNSEKIRKNSKNKHPDMANDQPITTNNVKESYKSDKSKNTVKDSKQQKTQKLDNKASSNIVTQSTQVNKALNKEKETVEDKSDSKQQRKSSANVIKNIKAKQKDDFLKGKEHKSSKDSVIQKIHTKGMKIKASETISKKSIGNINKQSINNPKLALATKTNKEKSQDTALPNLIKNSKDVSKKPTIANYLKNSFLPKAANKLKSALPTKIPRISPRKLSSIKSNIQDISKSSKTSQKSLQKATNIPRLLKKQQIFKTNKV
ncbi:DNA ligase 1-like [Aricia agestis]|uniref:DNA ligase 1-like n=1 Tax=Aricia agestis TaxID=91739 RepID=UPI001C207745|nr:DNA ligase 1-like [Aricia agestis]